jgi:hypothetical protein
MDEVMLFSPLLRAGFCICLIADELMLSQTLEKSYEKTDHEVTLFSPLLRAGFCICLIADELMLSQTLEKSYEEKKHGSSS